jgi:hypothetical protein
MHVYLPWTLGRFLLLVCAPWIVQSDNQWKKTRSMTGNQWGKRGSSNNQWEESRKRTDKQWEKRRRRPISKRLNDPNKVKTLLIITKNYVDYFPWPIIRSFFKSISLQMKEHFRDKKQQILACQLLISCCFSWENSTIIKRTAFRYF